MKALILNSGIGSRMGDSTHSKPKCMTLLANGQSILSRQINQLESANITEIIITTGPFHTQLEEHAYKSSRTARLSFINNPIYANTNYIYSIYLAREQLDDDIILLHGDLVFSDDVLYNILDFNGSVVITSSTSPLPEKDFKAIISNDRIITVSVDCFENAVASQPLYRLTRKEWLIWLSEIERFIASGQITCYAENAFNQISHQIHLFPFDIKDQLCFEIDTPEDLERINTLMQS